MGFTVKKRVLRRVRGSEKAVSRRCPERPLEECAPFGVRPILHFFPIFPAGQFQDQSRVLTIRTGIDTF